MHRHKTPWRTRVLSVAVLVAASPAWGSQLFIYPSKGQSPEQQNRDRYECHTWSVQQTGFDPTAPQTAQAAPPQANPRRAGCSGAERAALQWELSGAPLPGIQARGPRLGPPEVD